MEDIGRCVWSRVIHPRLGKADPIYRTPEAVLSSCRSRASDVISHELTGPHMKNDARMHDRVSHGVKKEEKYGETGEGELV